MDQARNVYMVGLMGAGKTTIGKILARKLRLRFLDSDHEIEARCGVRIPVIFELEGESGFRSREVQVIASLTHLRGILLATGGGTVLSAENRERLSTTGVVVYLRARPEDLYRRVRNDRNRPLIATADPLGRLRELYAQRDPLYSEVAHVVVDTASQSVQSLAQVVLGKLEEQCRRCV